MTVVGLSINERIREHSTIGVKLMGSGKPRPSVGLKKGIESLIIKGWGGSGGIVLLHLSPSPSQQCQQWQHRQPHDVPTAASASISPMLTCIPQPTAPFYLLTVHWACTICRAPAKHGKWSRTTRQHSSSPQGAANQVERIKWYSWWTQI